MALNAPPLDPPVQLTPIPAEMSGGVRFGFGGASSDTNMGNFLILGGVCLLQNFSVVAWSGNKCCQGPTDAFFKRANINSFSRAHTGSWMLLVHSTSAGRSFLEEVRLDSDRKGPLRC